MVNLSKSVSAVPLGSIYVNAHSLIEGIISKKLINPLKSQSLWHISQLFTFLSAIQILAIEENAHDVKQLIGIGV